MSSEVKRYDAVHLRYEDSNIRYGEGCEVEVVTASDHEREVQRAIAAGIRMQDKCAALEAERERLADALDRQSVITGDYIARCQRLADELAIARRVLDRIGQLCTTPHESKERFIRRVQSVIEWERAAQQDQPK